MYYGTVHHTPVTEEKKETQLYGGIFMPTSISLGGEYRFAEKWYGHVGYDGSLFYTKSWTSLNDKASNQNMYLQLGTDKLTNIDRADVFVAAGFRYATSNALVKGFPSDGRDFKYEATYTVPYILAGAKLKGEKKDAFILSFRQSFATVSDYRLPDTSFSKIFTPHTDVQFQFLSRQYDNLRFSGIIGFMLNPYIAEYRTIEDEKKLRTSAGYVGVKVYYILRRKK